MPQSPVDEKVVQEKIDTGKPLDKEEAKLFLSQEKAVDGYDKNDVQDMNVEDFDKETQGQEGEEKPETSGQEGETKAGKSETAETKGETKADKASPEQKRDFFVRLEQELVKEEGKEDLKDFTPREKAYFRQMRLDRKNRQRAEQDRDQALFRENKLKREIEEGKGKPEEKVEDPIAELKKRDPTDYMTVAEATALVEKVSAGKEKKEDKEKSGPSTVSPQQVRYLKFCEKEARETHPEDFDVVMELTEDIISNNAEHLTEVAKAMVAGENPALKAYDLIKADSRFAELLPLAQTKHEARSGENKKPEESKEGSAGKAGKAQDTRSDKSPEANKQEKEALKAQEALEKNRSKFKTTGHVESSSDSGDVPSFDEIARMSDREFARLPAKVRRGYLEQMKDL